jgi:hypothetical protein
MVKSLVGAVVLRAPSSNLARADDPLASSNDSPAKQAILEFIKTIKIGTVTQALYDEAKKTAGSSLA